MNRPVAGVRTDGGGTFRLTRKLPLPHDGHARQTKRKSTSGLRAYHGVSLWTPGGYAGLCATRWRDGRDIPMPIVPCGCASSWVGCTLRCFVRYRRTRPFLRGIVPTNATKRIGQRKKERTVQIPKPTTANRTEQYTFLTVVADNNIHDMIHRLDKRLRALGQFDLEHQSLVIEVISTLVGVGELAEIHVSW